MKRIVLALLITSFAVGSAMAQPCADPSGQQGRQAADRCGENQLHKKMQGGRVRDQSRQQGRQATLRSGEK